jgi:cytochrome P450
MAFRTTSSRGCAHAPVWWHPPHPKAPGGEGFWVVTRHAETLQVLRDAATFSSEGAASRTGGGTTLDDLPRGVGPGVMLNMMDPPRHDAIRGLVNKGFKPSTIAKLEAELRTRTDAILDTVVARGRCASCATRRSASRRTDVRSSRANAQSPATTCSRSSCTRRFPTRAERRDDSPTTS